jgi:hypothetical protein
VESSLEPGRPGVAGQGQGFDPAAVDGDVGELLGDVETADGDQDQDDQQA